MPAHSIASLLNSIRQWPRAIASTNYFRDTNGKLRNGWWIALFFLVLAALMFPLLMLARHHGTDLAIWQQAAIVAVASALIQAFRREPFQVLVGKLDLVWLKQLALGGLMGAALMALPALFLGVSGLVTWQPTAMPIAAVGAGFLACVAVAAAEELTFRGVLFQRLIVGLGVWPAQLLIAGYFLLTHSDNPGMAGHARVLASINIFLASILFGLTFLKTRRLAMPLGLHAMANFVQGSVLGFGVSGNGEPGLLKPSFGASPDWLTGGAFGLEASAPGLLWVVIAIALVFRYVPAVSAKQ